MKIQRNIRLLEIFTLCTNMSFIIPVILPYYRDQMGLDFKAFLLGEAAFAAVVVLLEVPSGWLSDIWQRKHVLALAAFANMFGYGCLLIGDNLVWAVAAQMILGIGISLISGTNTALLYDSLLSCNREGEFRKHEGRRAGLGFYSVAGGSIIGGFIYPLHHQLPVLLSIILLGAAVILACLMQEPSRHQQRPEKHPIADMIATAKYALHGHAEIGLIILLAAVMFCSTKLIMWSQQPYYMAMGVHESLFGFLMAAGFVLAGFSSQMGHKLDGKCSSMTALVGVCLVAILVCIGASVHVGWSGIVLLMLGGSCLYGMAAPRVSEEINSRVGSERRATILSTQNLMVNLLFIPVSTMIGWISGHYGITGALLGIAGWLGVTGLGLAFLINKYGRHHTNNI